MLLSDVTSQKMILLDQPWNNREVILENLSNLLF